MSANPTDDEQLARWVKDHALAVRGYLLALVRCPEDADDLLQEVFRKAWLARARYEERGHERAYLLRIADRLVCDRGRKVRKELQLPGDDWESFEPVARDPAAEEVFQQQESHAELNAALDTLSDSQKRVLLLRYFGGLEFSSIAEQLAQPLGSVLSHCHRGLAALRKLLTEKERA